MDNNEFVKNLFDKLTNDMCEKWNEIRDTLPKSQQKTALKDLDQKTVQFIKMAPKELITFRDEDDNNLGHYTAICELQEATNLLYKYEDLATQANFEGCTIEHYARDSKIKINKK